MNKLLDCCSNRKKCSPFGCESYPSKHIDAAFDTYLREAVQVPQGIDRNEWLALNTYDFFELVSVLYDTVSEFCTNASCPEMSAGPIWADGVTIGEPMGVSASEYINYLMGSIHAQLHDESIFPVKSGALFPLDFEDRVKMMISKKLFLVYGHMYHSHIADVINLQEEAHFNTCFKHFVLFTSAFRCIKEEDLAPFQDIIVSIIKS